MLPSVQNALTSYPGNAVRVVGDPAWPVSAGLPQLRGRARAGTPPGSGRAWTASAVVTVGATPSPTRPRAANRRR